MRNPYDQIRSAFYHFTEVYRSSRTWNEAFVRSQALGLRTFLLSWICCEKHRPEKYTFVTYESLRVDPARELARIAAFVERWNPPPATLKRAADRVACAVNASTVAALRAVAPAYSRADAPRPDAFFGGRAESSGEKPAFTPAMVAAVEAHLNFTFDLFGYDRRPPDA